MSETELREKIHSALFADDFPILNDIEKDAVDRVVAIIQQAQKADRKRVAIEEQIQAYRYVLGINFEDCSPLEIREIVGNWIAELKAQQEEG